MMQSPHTHVDKVANTCAKGHKPDTPKPVTLPLSPKRDSIEAFDDRDVRLAAAFAHRLQAVAATGALELV